MLNIQMSLQYSHAWLVGLEVLLKVTLIISFVNLSYEGSALHNYSYAMQFRLATSNEFRITVTATDEL